jgi:radical SAM protein with 4Fe4S-binding SPASM domain
MFVSINTNLLLLTPEIVTKLKELEINSLLVSCPASDPRIYRQITRCGDYSRLCSKLKLLLNSGISCMVNMVVTPTNHSFIRSTAVDMSKLGIKRFAATPASLNVEYPDYQELLSEQQTITLLEDLRWCADNLGLEVDVLEPMPKCFFPSWCWGKNYAFTKRVCQAGRMSVSISNIGDVRPCSHNPVSYGNLFQETLEEIWAKMNIYQENSVPAVCKCCPVVSSCNGACRTNALAATGLLNKPDRFTVGHINWPPGKPTEITISGDSVVHFKGTLRWRQEDKNYSISSKSNVGNLIVVNKEMFRFVSWLKESLPCLLQS